MPEAKKTRTLPAFVVSGTSSGSGKTLVALGMMEALRRRGLIVQPFKAGPDYIDPGLHSLLLGRPSYNLDTWMMGVKGVKKTFCAASSAADCAVVEGVMGLFDGRGGTDAGSTAHLSKVLGVPVVLVANAEKAARSMGAVIKGFETYDPSVDLSWVIFNKTGSVRHEKILRDSVRGSKVKVLGCIRRDAALALESRHLGLMTAGDMGSGWEGFVKAAGDAVESSVNLDGLLRGSKAVLNAGPLPPEPFPRVRIAIADDRAFSFYYRENLDILRASGAELVPFSPLSDKTLPEATSGIYIGGGYPELHAQALENNRLLRDGIRRAAEAGMPVYAECGGLMYLGKAIEHENRVSRMTGVFPWTTRLLPKRKALGYREAELTEDCPFLKKGKIRGHEFHYSEMSKDAAPGSAYRSSDGEGIREEGFVYRNVLASYIHLHFASNPSFAAGFVKASEEFSRRRK